jgi:hypothetical protein
MPHGPIWLQERYKEKRSALKTDTLNTLSNNIAEFAASISYWLQELLQERSNEQATIAKKKGRRLQIDAPIIRLNKFHGMLDKVAQTIETGNKSIITYWIKDDRKAPLIDEVVVGLKKLSDEFDAQRLQDEECIRNAIQGLREKLKTSKAITNDFLITTLEEMLRCFSSKLELLNVIEYTSAQSLRSIHTNMVSFLHSECGKTNTNIRILKAHLKLKMENFTREKRSMVDTDMKLQTSITGHMRSVDRLLAGFGEHNIFADNTVETRALIKSLYAVHSVLQDLRFADAVKDNAQREYNTLLVKFKSFR